MKLNVGDKVQLKDGTVGIIQRTTKEDDESHDGSFRKNYPFKIESEKAFGGYHALTKDGYYLYTKVENHMQNVKEILEPAQKKVKRVKEVKEKEPVAVSVPNMKTVILELAEENLNNADMQEIAFELLKKSTKKFYAVIMTEGSHEILDNVARINYKIHPMELAGMLEYIRQEVFEAQKGILIPETMRRIILTD